MRWLQLMEENKGKIDVAAGQRFLADHFDTFENKVDPDERTLCGHIDLSPRGDLPWLAPYAPAGAVQNKVADAAMAEAMTLRGRAGPRLRTGIQGRRAPAQAPRVRLAAARAARHAVTSVDHLQRAVGQASWPVQEQAGGLRGRRRP